MVDSFYVLKRPRIACRSCSKQMYGGIEGMDLVVLEYEPTKEYVFVCTSCASKRVILDHLAERLQENRLELERYADKYAERRQDVDNE